MAQDTSRDTSSLIQRKDRRSLSTLVGLTVLLSLLIVGYVFFVSQFAVQQKGETTVQQAAWLAAHELAEITVAHPAFGRVGLADRPPVYTPAGQYVHNRVLGLNTLKATLRLDALIARQVESPYMIQLVHSDLEALRLVESQLAFKMRRALDPNPYQDELTGQLKSIYQDVYKLLSMNQGADGEVRDIKLKLGEVGEEFGTSHVNVPSSLSDVPPRYVTSSGQYRANVPVPVPGEQPIEFISLSMGPPLVVPPGSFVETPSDVVSSVVLVEVTYRKSSSHVGEGVALYNIRTAAAMAGSPIVRPIPSALVFNFPEGKPSPLNSAIDLLDGKKWKAAGMWQQAIGSSVPGEGTLGPLPGAETYEMPPDQAMTMALYHWLRQMGTTVNPSSILSLLRYNWTELESAVAANAAGGAHYNSCLVRDTGARKYLIFNQTSPGGAGQNAIDNAFSSGDPEQHFPPSALPLIVDKLGDCNMVGRPGIDRQLLLRFFTGLQQTNLAGIESAATAQTVRERTITAIRQLEHQLLVRQQEVQTIRQSKVRFSGQSGAQQPSPAQQRLAQVQRELEGIEDERSQLTAVRSRAERAIANAQSAAVKSFQLSSQLSRYAREGIFRAREPKDAFILGGKFMFVPHVRPLTEEALMRQDELPLVKEWTSSAFLVLYEVRGEAPYAENLKSLREMMLPTAQPLVIIFDSFDATSTSLPRPKVYVHSPFANTPVPAGGLFYYAHNSLTTGRVVPVEWSVVMRDMVAFRTDRYTGEPQGSSKPDWCRGKFSGSICPGLAAEVQVRSPLPSLPNFGFKSYVTNPTTQQQVPLVPPLPGDMF